MVNIDAKIFIKMLGITLLLQSYHKPSRYALVPWDAFLSRFSFFSLGSLCVKPLLSQATRAFTKESGGWENSLNAIKEKSEYAWRWKGKTKKIRDWNIGNWAKKKVLSGQNGSRVKFRSKSDLVFKHMVHRCSRPRFSHIQVSGSIVGLVGQILWSMMTRATCLVAPTRVTFMVVSYVILCHAMLWYVNLCCVMPWL